MTRRTAVLQLTRVPDVNGRPDGRSLLILLIVGFMLLPISANAQGSLEKVAVSLHDNWYVQSSANVTATGATISTQGFSIAGWLKTNIPATPVGAQLDNALYPSPYVGQNAQ